MKLRVSIALLLSIVSLNAFALGFRTTPSAAFTTGSPASTNNDDSCDISNQPAATLLLPYFEVDFKSPASTAQTTLFTVTNTTPIPQIAHVTLWTDWSFPVLDFNIFLTGYDVQGINMWDIMTRGVIAPGPTPTTGGTSINTTVPTNPTAGSQPAANNGNPNFLPAVSTSCTELPGNIPAPLLADMQLLFTTGRATGAAISCTAQVGSVHSNAIGYATIDVAANCSTTLPTDPTYYTGELLFDNALIGDYQQINPNPATGNYAGGNPMVHIKAIPEGGAAGTGVAVATNLPYTFYDRYTAGNTTGVRTVDRRQPLPSMFAARYIQGGTNAFNTNYKIWREGVTGANAACSSSTYSANSGTAMRVIDIVRFDEHENATTLANGVVISPLPSTTVILPETSSVSTANTTVFPPFSTSGDVAGWMYLNLNNGGNAAYSVTSAGVSSNAFPTPRDFRTGTSTGTGVRQNQDWVVVSMFAEGRYSVDFDAASLSNGCSPSILPSSAGGQIGPAPNATP